MPRNLKTGPKRFRKTGRDLPNGQVYRHGSYHSDKHCTAYSPRRCLRDRPVGCHYSLGGRHPLYDTADALYQEYLWDLEDTPPPGLEGYVDEQEEPWWPEFYTTTFFVKPEPRPHYHKSHAPFDRTHDENCLQCMALDVEDDGFDHDDYSRDPWDDYGYYFGRNDAA